MALTKQKKDEMLAECTEPIGKSQAVFTHYGGLNMPEIDKVRMTGSRCAGRVSCHEEHAGQARASKRWLHRSRRMVGGFDRDELLLQGRGRGGQDAGRSGQRVRQAQDRGGAWSAARPSARARSTDWRHCRHLIRCARSSLARYRLRPPVGVLNAAVGSGCTPCRRGSTRKRRWRDGVAQCSGPRRHASAGASLSILACKAYITLPTAVFSTPTRLEAGADIAPMSCARNVSSGGSDASISTSLLLDGLAADHATHDLELVELFAQIAQRLGHRGDVLEAEADCGRTDNHSSGTVKPAF